MQAEGLAEHRAGKARSSQVLENRWRRKLDELIILSRACYASQATAPGGAVDEEHGLPSGRLELRLAQAHSELAQIGAAIEMISAGSVTTCDGCGRPMPYEWVAETINPDKCPDCCLDSVQWPRIRGKPGPA
jgi:RNA polymerase-binding transcription factor DksA